MVAIERSVSGRRTSVSGNRECTVMGFPDAGVLWMVVILSAAKDLLNSTPRDPSLRSG
jgi:hypothetical protein